MGADTLLLRSRHISSHEHAFGKVTGSAAETIGWLVFLEHGMSDVVYFWSTKYGRLSSSSLHHAKGSHVVPLPCGSIMEQPAVGETMGHDVRRALEEGSRAQG